MKPASTALTAVDLPKPHPELGAVFLCIKKIRLIQIANRCPTVWFFRFFNFGDPFERR
jgi:hypothetical protein